MKELFHNKRVLIVDDEPEVRQLLVSMLRPIHGSLEVLEAENGQVALDLAREHQPHVIVLDLHLPIMDGYAVLTQLKAIEETRKIPVAVLTGYGGRLTEADVVKSGADVFLEKPIAPIHFLATVAGLMRIKSNYDQLDRHAAELRAETIRFLEALSREIGEERVGEILQKEAPGLASSLGV
jgi:CheY-like chemotaxis protein